jgi:glycine/D-amino acid oxidase-like deaminating enzyme
MQTCDVLVIGAGIAGGVGRLRDRRVPKVILLERESQPGYHATGRSAAVFGPAYGNRVIRALTAASHAFYRDEAGGLADHPVLAPLGTLFIARQDQLGALDALQAGIAPEVAGLERLDVAQVRARVPVLNAGYVAGGLYDPSSMDLDVAAIHQGYLKGLRARGGKVVADAEVSAITTATPPWPVETRAGPFEAAVLVDAAGAWADELAAMAGAAPLGLVAMRRTALLFQTSIDADPAWPLVDDADEQFYFKPESGLLLGFARRRDADAAVRCPARGAGCRDRDRSNRARRQLSGHPRPAQMGGAAHLRARQDAGGRHGEGHARLLLAGRPGRLWHPDRAGAGARRCQATGRRRAAGRSAWARSGGGGSPAAALARRARRDW